MVGRPLNNVIGKPDDEPTLALAGQNVAAASQSQTIAPDNDNEDEEAARSSLPAALSFVTGALNDPKAPVDAATPAGLPPATGRQPYNHLKSTFDTNGPAFSARMADRARDAVKYFTSQGWTQNQAIGIVGNLIVESGLNPNAVGDNGQAYGLAQMHADRRQRLEDVFGKSFKDMNFSEQLQAVNYELRQGSEQRAGHELSKTTTIEDAANTVMRLYERCADQGRQSVIRVAAANRAANSMGVA